MDINKLKILFTEEQIQSRIKELADEMNKFYGNEEHHAGVDKIQQSFNWKYLHKNKIMLHFQ